MVTEHRLSITRACRTAGLSRAAYYKAPRLPQEKDAEVIDALNGVVERNARWGFWKCFDRLRLDGRPWNHKRVWRVYCELGLNIPRRTKRRVPKREPVPLAAGSFVNQGWALDFMHDVLYDGRRFRTLNVIDEANCGALAIQVARRRCKPRSNLLQPSGFLKSTGTGSGGRSPEALLLAAVPETSTGRRTRSERTTRSTQK